MGLGRGFASGFLMGIQGANAGLSAYYKGKEMDEQEKMKAEMGDIANAKPEDTMVVTPTMEGFKGAGPDESGAISQYDQSDAPVVRKAGVKFLGQTYDQAPTDSQQNTARTLAMAGTMKKYDPLKGMQLEQQALSSQREEQRFGQEQKQWQRQDDERKREDEHRTKRDDLLKNSPMGQYQVAMAKSAQEQAAYDAGIKAGKSPEELGPPPQKPNIQRPGPMQIMASHAALIAHDYQYGKLNTEGLINFQNNMQKAEDENYVKALKVAHGGGTPEQIAKSFNSAGIQVDPKNITISRTQQANGPDQVTLNYKDDKGQETSVNVMAELDAHGKAKEIFDHFYQGKKDQREDKHLKLDEKKTDSQVASAAVSNALHGAQLDKLKEDSKDRATLQGIRTNLQEAIANKDKTAEDSLRKQLMVYGTGIKGTTNTSPEERLGLYFMATGAAKDEAEAARMAHEKKQSSPKDDYMALMKPNSNGMALKHEDVAKIMISMHGENWLDQLGNKGKAAGLSKGKVVDGFEYLGGDPKDQKSWREKK
ncbi:hypothetical protein B9Z51_08590 [Limnohabitans sp. T6-5]|uniref:hypothetical protein n=1 Tax=Limnohabitans sp. T6-5 TaxID=1100724 RepID=UPI000D382959|nr:hypothetical protein [Limnohabitans sp. T6-5]PUE08981.1 hypothetical protein B9Z51_08590 [Limnohabitans sp. T6-5]